MSVIIGIDIGGSTTKIVGFARKNDGWELLEPQIIRANDPVTSTYGAFGKFTDENSLGISDISKIMMTGVQHTLKITFTDLIAKESRSLTASAEAGFISRDLKKAWWSVWEPVLLWFTPGKTAV